jgi:hypothetical protein
VVTSFAEVINQTGDIVTTLKAVNTIAKRNVAYWHLADNRCVAIVCPLLDQSGQVWAFG